MQYLFRWSAADGSWRRRWPRNAFKPIPEARLISKLFWTEIYINSLVSTSPWVDLRQRSAQGDCVINQLQVKEFSFPNFQIWCPHPRQFASHLLAKNVPQLAALVEFLLQSPNLIRQNLSTPGLWKVPPWALGSISHLSRWLCLIPMLPAIRDGGQLPAPSNCTAWCLNSSGNILRGSLGYLLGESFPHFSGVCQSRATSPLSSWSLNHLFFLSSLNPWKTHWSLLSKNKTPFQGTLNNFGFHS